MVELTLRIIFSLLVVVGLMWGLARLARRPLGSRRGGAVAVLGRQQLSKGAAVAVIRVGGKAIVLGVTDTQVSLLGETELAAFEESLPELSVRRQPVPLAELPGLAGAAGRRRPIGASQAGTGPLAGSVLSLRTWRQAAQVLRDKAARRS